MERLKINCALLLSNAKVQIFPPLFLIIERQTGKSPENNNLFQA
jgi:hypothetical protein